MIDATPTPTPMQPLPHRLTVYQDEVRAGARRHADGLVHVDPAGSVARRARPTA